MAGERRSGRDGPAGLQKGCGEGREPAVGRRLETAVAGGCVEQEAGSQDRRKEKSLLGLIVAVRIKHSSSVLGSAPLSSLFENVLHATWKTHGNPELAERGPHWSSGREETCPRTLDWKDGPHALPSTSSKPWGALLTCSLGQTRAEPFGIHPSPAYRTCCSPGCQGRG